MIDGSTYKTLILTDSSATAAAGYLPNSAWFMIDQGSPKTVITVNVNEYAINTSFQLRFGTSHICIGKNSAGPLATGNNCSPAFFSGGFKKLPDLLPGQNTGRYVFVYRAGDSNGSNRYLFSEIGLYGLPNLVEFARIITEYSPKSPEYGTTNLNTNLGLRT